jgi:hypothetical protein
MFCCDWIVCGDVGDVGWSCLRIDLGDGRGNIGWFYDTPADVW